MGGGGDKNLVRRESTGGIFPGGGRGMSKFPASEGDSPHPPVGKTLDLTGSNC